MRTTGTALLLGLALLLSGCEKDEETRTVELQMGGDASLASVSWRENGRNRQEIGVELPWTHSFQARDGDDVIMIGSAASATARLWARALEDGEEVRLVPGCLCNGSGVSVTIEGVVGGWGD